MIKILAFSALFFSFCFAEMISIGGGGGYEPARSTKTRSYSDSKYSYSGFTVGTNVYFVNKNFMLEVMDAYSSAVNIGYPYNINVGYIFKNSLYVGGSLIFAENSESKAREEVTLSSLRIAKNVYSPAKGHKTLLGVSYKYLGMMEYEKGTSTNNFMYEQGAISLDVGYVFPINKHILIEALFSLDLGIVFDDRSGKSLIHFYEPYAVDTSAFSIGVKLVF